MSGLEVTMMKRIGELNAEVKYLQDKVERLTAEVSYDNRVQLHIDKLAAEFTQSEVERLQAEVERLRAGSFVTAVPSEHYERVIKAGDAMAFNYEQMHDIDGVYDSDLMKFVARWNAAKEGRPNE